jgi:hypothetical protein
VIGEVLAGGLLVIAVLLATVVIAGVLAAAGRAGGE